MNRFVAVMAMCAGILTSAHPQMGDTTAIPVQDIPGSLWVWSANGSQPYLVEYFALLYPEITVEVDTIGQDLMQRILSGATENVGISPDIIIAQDTLIPALSEKKVLLELDSLVTDDELSQLVPFTKQISRGSGGKLYALMYSVHPVAVCYRRSLARQFFGTDDPESVAARFADWESFTETARFIQKKSGGAVTVTAGPGDVELLLFKYRDSPWVSRGRISAGEGIRQSLPCLRELFAEGAIGSAALWSPEWFAGMNGNVFSYFLPLWGTEYVLRPNTVSNPDDWAVCAAPVSRFWNAPVIAICTESEKKLEAFLFLKSICLDERYGIWINTRIREVPAHTGALAALAARNNADGSSGGQCAMSIYRDIAMAIDSSGRTCFDDQLESILSAVLADYYRGGATLQEALDEFYKRGEKIVKNSE